MSNWLAEQLILKLANNKIQIVGAEVLVLGFTFKENCPDLRNTKIYDFIKRLNTFGIKTVVVDPCVDPLDASELFGISVLSTIPSNTAYDAVVSLVAHHQFLNFSSDDWARLVKSPSGILFDYVYPRVLNQSGFNQ